MLGDLLLKLNNKLIYLITTWIIVFFLLFVLGGLFNKKEKQL